VKLRLAKIFKLQNSLLLP